MNDLSIGGEQPVHPAVERARERARRKDRCRRRGVLWEIAYLILEALSWLGHLIKWW